MIQARVQYQANIIFELLTAHYHLVVDAFTCRIGAKPLELLMRLFTVQNQFTDTKHDSKILQAYLQLIHLNRWME